MTGRRPDLWRQMLERPAEIIADAALTWAVKLDAVVEHWMRFEFDSHDTYQTLHESGRGVGYARSPFAYLFTRVS